MVEGQSIPEENQDEDTKDEAYRHQKLEREQYMENLQKWLDDARLWHYNLCTVLPYNPNGSLLNDNPQQQIYRHIAHANLWHSFQQQGLVDNSFVNRVLPTYSQPTHQQLHNNPPSTYEFVIPPLWKRAVAELMDFSLLFLFKMTLTFVLLESFDIIDMGLYGFESFQKNLENPDVTSPVAVELLTLELVHRVIVCAYETYFLKGKLCATPGKRYMGLMVITADNILPVPGRLNITATGAANLGWQKSLTRAALKNLFLGLFLPLCVAFYILPHNRTSYDMMSNSIVVEYHQEFMLYNTAV